MSLQELLDEYREKFGDIFPMMACMDMSDEEVAEEVRKCLDSGRPFDIGEVIY